MKKIELLSPAGDLERLKYAIIYGADAVYIGGKEFSLRSAASNFTLADILSATSFAHKHHAKIYVTMNMVMHENDTKNILTYLKDLESRGVDGVIASSFEILKLVKEETKMEAHVSTQLSIYNSSAISFLEKHINVDRVVLARECSINEIEKICKKVKKEIEVFVHGAMCSSFSGRCMLSNIMTNRDANRGGCAQSCRWCYNLYNKEKEKLNLNEYDFSLASKDLNALEYLPRLISSGVTSLKIEGRMKTLHYVASVVSAYRNAIDEYYKYKTIKDINIYKNILKKAENRETSIGFLNGEITSKEVIYTNYQSSANHDFLGIVRKIDENFVYIEVRNPFRSFYDVEILSPKKTPYLYRINEIYTEDDKEINFINHPNEIIKIKNNGVLKEFDLIREK